jgi:hypothetical protein
MTRVGDNLTFRLPQFLYGLEPIFVGRSLRTAASLPDFVRQSGDVVMPKSGGGVGVLTGDGFDGQARQSNI